LQPAVGCVEPTFTSRREGRALLSVRTKSGRRWQAALATGGKIRRRALQRALLVMVRPNVDGKWTMPRADTPPVTLPP
jgi:hypothetical protein